jgi:hypothetical protein
MDPWKSRPGDPPDGAVIKADPEGAQTGRTYPPPEPLGRPGKPFRIEWANIVSLVKKVYELRSDAVHEGRPFPAPLLDPPLPAVHPPREAPGTTVGAGESVWTPADMPVYLHVFAGVVGSVLRNWWRSLAPAS